MGEVCRPLKIVYLIYGYGEGQNVLVAKGAARFFMHHHPLYSVRTFTCMRVPLCAYANSPKFSNGIPRSNCFAHSLRTSYQMVPVIRTRTRFQQAKRLRPGHKTAGHRQFATVR
jgi:hypothetical protein